MTYVFYNGKYLIMSSYMDQITCNKHCCDKTLLMFFPNVYIQTQPIKKFCKLFKSKYKGYCGTICDSHGHQLPLSAFFG